MSMREERYEAAMTILICSTTSELETSVDDSAYQ
jgi:hypothetical protein